jgi:hypothetical protein
VVVRNKNNDLSNDACYAMVQKTALVQSDKTFVTTIVAIESGCIFYVMCSTAK